MDQIEHKYVEVNGLKLHVAEIGSGSSPAVVFLHGFPEIWYSWRHQMIAVASAGFRAIALDYRGYGLSDPPPEPEKTTFLDLVGDLLALYDALSISKIEHKYVEVNGLKLHVAEIGSGSSPAVVFLHGFPEIWYSWRHQMIAVASAGFRAIALDYRGYGLSDPPPEPEKTTFLDLVGDLLALYDALSISKAFLIAKDFGAIVASIFAVLYQDRILGFVTLGVPFYLPRFLTSDKQLPEGFYMSRWKEPGRAESDFGRLDAKTVVRNVYILFSRSEIPIAHENEEIMDLVDSSTPLPSWFTEEDLATYGMLYEKSGFQTALQVPYRSFHEQVAKPDPKVQVPALLIMGEKDYVFRFPGMADYITSGKVKTFVPNLEISFIPEGTHFVQEQLLAQVNDLILNFLRSHNN
ncbi:unnamed protein product [Fraxinus pennsylvanica]|uniref:AB hydrolase-1 domain-containing protein n=1 Tax=Fraxinus pennsylvanica TaxID=56036 RepID=A0AAD1YSK3_9LAMI|nr:unnamed protein product [Fraxinus pennsylvanica]